MSRRRLALGFALTALGAGAACAAFAACAARGHGAAGECRSELAIQDLAIATNPNSVLSATITLSTATPTTCTLAVKNTGPGGESNSFTAGPFGAPATRHSIPVLGLRASSSFELVVTATDAAGHAATGTVSFATGPLPANIPPLQVVVDDKAHMAPGFTLMTTWKWRYAPVASVDSGSSYIVALDADGKVVWYYRGEPRHGATPTAPERLPNGHLVFLTEDAGMSEIDMMGNVVATRTAASLGLDSMHHALEPEPGGNLLSLGTELRSVGGYPQADGGTATYSVVGDVIEELSPDGHVLHTWSAFDFLGDRVHDQGDFPVGFNLPFWNPRYPDAGATKDWTHGNAVHFDPEGDVLYSTRTLSWIIKLQRDDRGGLRRVWKLGPRGDFTLTNPDETFQYNQHAAYFTPSGTLMCFDNGNSRPRKDGAARSSRALEYSLDTRRMTATIVWQYRETPPFFSPFLGSAVVLSNGNVLVCDGGELGEPASGPFDPKNLKFARVMEVTHEATPRKVFEVDIKVPLGSLPDQPYFSGFSVYRAQRIASLY